MSILFHEDFQNFATTPKGTSTTWATSLVPQETRSLNGKGEGEYYSDSSVGVNPFTITSKGLVITAAPCAPASNPLGKPYISGVITSINLFSFTYGRVDVVAQLPAGAGWWPAFWLLPASHYHTAELDIMENWKNEPTQIQNTVQGYPNTDNTGTWINDSVASKVGNVVDFENTFSVDWGPEFCTFYFNNKQIAQLKTPPSMNVPMYFVANLAVSTDQSWMDSQPDANAVAELLISSVTISSNEYTVTNT